MRGTGWTLAAILATATAAVLWSRPAASAGMSCSATGPCNLRCCDTGSGMCTDTPINNCSPCNAGAYCWQGTCMGGFPPECIDGGMDGGFGGPDAGGDAGFGGMDAGFGMDAGRDGGAPGDAGPDAGMDAGTDAGATGGDGGAQPGTDGGTTLNPFGCSCGVGTGALWSAAFAVLLGLLFKGSRRNA